MTVLTAIQGASLSLGLAYPSVVFSSTEKTWRQMQDTANECAIQIAQSYDWQRLKKTATFTGDDVVTAFSLPNDYDRMVKDANIWGPSMAFYLAQQVVDFNQWLEYLTYTPESWVPRWALFGNQINILPPPALGEVYTYGYISNWIVNSTATQFTSDADTFVLDERLLKLSIIWNWKKSQGDDYSAELAEYNEAMNRAIFKDTGSRPTIISGRSRYRFPTGQTLP